MASIGDRDRAAPAFGWKEVEASLADCLADIEIRMINGTAKDALDYVEQDGRGLKVIAIGGDKLARGLTLDGLCVSYFLRASKMYDTLMQMGRWFGYRPGYLDICRLYTTNDLVEWFRHIAEASEELREEFEMMQASGRNAARLRFEGPVTLHAHGDFAGQDENCAHSPAIFQRSGA